MIALKSLVKKKTSGATKEHPQAQGPPAAVREHGDCRHIRWKLPKVVNRNPPPDDYWSLPLNARPVPQTTHSRGPWLAEAWISLATLVFRGAEKTP